MRCSRKGRSGRQTELTCALGGSGSLTSTSHLEEKLWFELLETHCLAFPEPPLGPGRGKKTITSSHSACNQELGLVGHMALASRAGSGRLAWHWDLQPHVVRSMQGRDQRPSSAGDPETPGRWLVRAQDPRKNMLPPSGIFPCLQGLGRDGTKSQSESQGLPVSLRPRLWVSGHGLH